MNEQTQEIQWTGHVTKCAVCKRRFRIMQGAWDEAKVMEPTFSDEELVGFFECCYECSFGEPMPGEYDVPQPEEAPEAQLWARRVMLPVIVQDLMALAIPFRVSYDPVDCRMVFVGVAAKDREAAYKIIGPGIVWI